MKIALTLIIGVVMGIVIAVGGGYLLVRYYETSYLEDTYQPDWMPEFDEQLHDSAAELAAARSSTRSAPT